MRICSRPNCSDEAKATLYSDYKERAAILDKLSKNPVYGARDLCAFHSNRQNVANDWVFERRIEKFKIPKKIANLTPDHAQKLLDESKINTNEIEEDSNIETREVKPDDDLTVIMNSVEHENAVLKIKEPVKFEAPKECIGTQKGHLVAIRSMEDKV